MMWDLFKDFLWVLRKRDSESACCAVIGLTELLSDCDVRSLRDYFTAILESRSRQSTEVKTNDPQQIAEAVREILNLTMTPWHLEKQVEQILINLIAANPKVAP